MDNPPYKNRVEVAEVSGYHNNGSFFRKISQLFDLSYDLDLVAQGVTIPEEGAEFFYACAIKQTRKPEFDDLSREAV